MNQQDFLADMRNKRTKIRSVQKIQTGIKDRGGGNIQPRQPANDGTCLLVLPVEKCDETAKRGNRIGPAPKWPCFRRKCRVPR